MNDIASVRPTRDELLNRLPEIKSIDGQTATEVIEAFVNDVPPYFWIARSSEDHHPPDERGLCGMWLHTKRAYTAYRLLEPTYRAMSRIDAYEANCGRAAILLHDAFKYGRDPSTVVDDTDIDVVHEYADGYLSDLPAYTWPAHDIEMAEYIQSETDLPAIVSRCVASHGGSADWYGHEGPSPSDDIEMLVHTADMIASHSEHRLPVWKPIEAMSRTIAEPIPTIDDESWIN